MEERQNQTEQPVTAQQPVATQQPAATEQPVQPVTAEQPAQPAAEQKPQGKNRKGAVAALLTCAIVLLCLQGILMILYLAGIITLFGDSVDIVSVFEIIEDLFRFNRASAYYILTGFAFAIIYIVMFIFMVRSFVISVRNCALLKKMTPPYIRIAMVEFSERLSEMFFLYTCVPIAIAAMMGETHLSGAAVAMLVLVPLAQVAQDVVMRLTADKRAPIGEMLFDIGKNAFQYALFCVLVSLLRAPVFRDFIRGAIILFNGNIGFSGGFFSFLHLFYIHLIAPVLYVVLLALCYRVIAVSLLDPLELRKRRAHSVMKRAVIFAGVLLGTQLVLGALLANVLEGFSAAMFGDWFLLVRDSHLPVFALLVGCMLLDFLWEEPKPLKPVAAKAGQ